VVNVRARSVMQQGSAVLRYLIEIATPQLI
jgi:hypothetical protein